MDITNYYWIKTNLMNILVSHRFLKFLREIMSGVNWKFSHYSRDAQMNRQSRQQNKMCKKWMVAHDLRLKDKWKLYGSSQICKDVPITILFWFYSSFYINSLFWTDSDNGKHKVSIILFGNILYIVFLV